MMLDRILGHSEPGRDLSEDFGVRLDSAAIDGFIAQSCRGAFAYATTHPNEIQTGTDAIDHVMGGEEGADCREDAQALYDGLNYKKEGDIESAAAAVERGKAIHGAWRRIHVRIDAPFRDTGFYPLLDRIGRVSASIRRLRRWTITRSARGRG